MNNKKIAVIGLEYVGLLLAVEFSKKLEVIGFDIYKDRISDLEKGINITDKPVLHKFIEGIEVSKPIMDAVLNSYLIYDLTEVK